MIVNIILIIQFDKIQNLVKIYDYPDSERKLHSRKTPIIGGLIILINLLMLLSLRIILSEETYFWNETINTYREIFSFFVTSILLFFVGLYDDKNSISPNLKLLIISLIIYFSIQIDPLLVIDEIKLSFHNKVILLNDANTIITLICFLLFINAYNMIDGIDLLAGTYGIIIFTYFVFNEIYVLPSLIIAFSLMIFLYFNYMKKTFLGDSGTLLIAYLISYIFIKGYNNGQIEQVDDVILLMIIPGFDLMRLAFERLYNRKNPFKPDRAHLHHLLQVHINNRVFCTMLILVIFFTPYILSVFIVSELISLIISMILYLSLILSLRARA